MSQMGMQYTRAFAAQMRVVEIQKMAPWRLFIDKLEKKWGFYHQFGLLNDDMCDEERDDLYKEAVRRLPEALVIERNWRRYRALDLSAKKIILPKEEWTKYEEDYPYLQPFIEEVKKEEAEKKAWYSQYV